MKGIHVYINAIIIAMNIRRGERSVGWFPRLSGMIIAYPVPARLFNVGMHVLVRVNTRYPSHFILGSTYMHANTIHVIILVPSTQPNCLLHDGFSSGTFRIKTA